MAKKTRITRIESLPLAQSFSHAKRNLKITEYKSPGILARILLEAFIFEDGNITSEWLLREKVCTKGSFTRLRDRLIKDQFLHFREDTLRYFPGIRLKPHLDVIKESKNASLADIETMDAKKADRSELRDLDNKKADKADITELREDIRDIRAQLHQLFQKLDECNQPPPSEEKQEEARLISKQIRGLLTNNKVN
jgi:hypothetical protein